MSLFPIVDGRARFDASGNVASDRYAAGIRFTQEGAARSQTSAGTNFNQGIPMSESGQVSLVDASSGLPADVVWLSGLPISGNRVCISNKPVSVVSSGIPYDSAGAVAATVAPITTLPTLDLVFAGTATDPLDAATTADDTLGLNFVSQAYQIAAQYAVWGTGGLQQVNFADIVTFTRASTATYFDSTGTLQTATTNTARFDYNPSTLAAQGLLIEEQRTNSIRNNTMQGAVAGTPGTAPTNWVVVSSGLTQTIVGTGTSAGVTYIDIRVNGTTTSAGGVQIKPDGNAGAIAATASQAWAFSTWVAIVGGSTTNTTGQKLYINEYSAGPTYLRTTLAANNILAAGASLTRVLGAITTGASTTIIEPLIVLEAASGVAIDITLRIGLPQLEQGAFATSVIPTTTTALTRSADVASVNTLSPWFNATEGTLYAEVQAAAGFNVAGLFGRYAAIQDALNNNSVEMFFDGPVAGAPRYRVKSGGVNQAVGSSATGYTANTTLKASLAYKVNDFAGVSRGVVDLTDTSGVVPVGPTVLSLGSEGGTINYLNGWLRRVTYYPRRLSNADLQTITA